jgi:glycosyltransferase involved in cell wall biosynthesis
LLSFFEILTLYRKIKPDIVHQVALKPVIVGTLAARIARIDRIINAFAGLGFLFTTKSKLKAIFKKLAFFTLKVILDTPRVRLILQNTEDLKLMLSEEIISKGQAVIIRGSGVNLTVFHPGREPCSPPLVVLASRMLWDKGVGEFVQAAKLINSNGRKAKFVLVGGPDADNPASISIRQLEDWHSDGIVEWWGQRDDMPSIFARSDIVCLPSYREGLPKVLLEAGASAKPVVTTDTIGCREVIQNGVNGLIVAPRNPHELANAIKKLLDDADLRKAMGARGREIVENEFSEEKIVEKTLRLYRETMKSDRV